MIPGTIDGEEYPFALDESGLLQWQTVQVAEERDEVWEDWSLSMGEAQRETGRGHFFSKGFDPSVKDVLRLSPFYQNDNNPTDLTTGQGYLIEAVGGTPETIAFSGSASSGSTAAASTLTVSHTVASGTNRILIVGMAANRDSTITFAGQNMTKLVSASISGQVAAQIWYLISPPVVTANIVATFLPIDTTAKAVMGAANYTGVDGNTPFGDAVGVTGTGDTTATDIVASAANELVIDSVAVKAGPDLTVGAGQTARYETTESSQMTGAHSTEAGGASVTMSWTWTGAQDWAIVAAPLKQASTTGGQQYVFIADNDNIVQYTYDPDTGLTDEAVTNVGSGVAGRPAKMNGKWYVPFGSGANARRLDDADTPTWADAGWTADHLATFQKGVQPTLARVNATTQNTVDLNADTSGNVGDTWTNASELVGNSTAKITDLVEAEGLLFVAKEDGLYDFGTEAESRPILTGFDSGNIDSANGKGTHAFFDTIFYPSNQGLWRYKIGGGARPVGLSELDGFRRVPNINAPKNRRAVYVTHRGKFVYVLYNGNERSLLVQLRPGTTREYDVNEVLDIPLSLGMVPDRNGRLWLKGASTAEGDRDIRVIHLDAYGGTDVEDRRGQVDEDHDIYFDERNPGRFQDTVQLRRMAVELEGDWDATTSLQMKVWLDDGTSAVSFGSAITASGLTTRLPTTFGTSDTCRRFRPQLTLTTNSSYTPKILSPEILRVIVGIRFPEIIRIVVNADPEVLKAAGKNAFEVEQNLRRLQNQGTVTFRRPGDYDDPATGTDLVTDRTFSGEVEGVTDIMYKTSEGYAHGLELRVKRWITY